MQMWYPLISLSFLCMFYNVNDENREISSIDIYHKMPFLSFKNQEMWNLEYKR